jgi:hypothetical protein
LRLLIFSGALLILVVFIPLGLTAGTRVMRTCTSATNNYFLVLLGVGIGSPVVLLYFLCLTSVKLEALKFQNLLMPFFTSLSWCCCVLPFCVAVPVISAFLNQNEGNY